jgi:hypothetical protein
MGRRRWYAGAAPKNNQAVLQRLSNPAAFAAFPRATRRKQKLVETELMLPTESFLFDIVLNDVHAERKGVGLLLRLGWELIE